MRNLKRALSLALAAVMVLGLMIVGAGAADVYDDFTDKDEIDHAEAVQVMVALNVIAGKEDGSFYDPTGTLTRAEMAKIVSYVMNGGVEPVLGTKVTPTYSDIDGHWAEAYIEYCTSMGIIAGDGAGKFNPEGTLTGSQTAKMFLTAMGYNAEVFGLTGTNWEINTNRYANEAGLYEDLSNVNPTDPISRDDAAQMAYNAIQATMMHRTWSQDMQTGELTETYDLWVDTDGFRHTLLGEKFDGVVAYGYMTAVDYDDARDEYTYNFEKQDSFGADEIKTDGYDGTLTTTLDVSALYGQKVKVIYKDDRDKTVYGIYAEDSSVLVSGAAGDVEQPDADATSVKIAGTTYRLDDEAGNINVYDYRGTVPGTPAKLTSLAEQDTGYTFKLIDNDGNGRANVVVKVPFTVTTVTYVGTTSITLKDGGSKKLDDISVYEDVAKDDVVVTYDASVVAKDIFTVEKAEVANGTISAIRDVDSDNNYRIDGTWYGNTTSEALDANDTIDYVAIGSKLYYVKVVSGQKDVDDIVVLLGLKPTSASATEDKKLEANALFADGSKEMITLVKADGTTGEDTDYTCGIMYTFDVNSDGEYVLTAVSTDNLAGQDHYGKGLTNSDGLTGDIEKANTYTIADDAVVFVYQAATAGKAGDGKVYTGKDLKSKDTTDFTGASTAGVLSGKVNGFEYANIICVAGDLPDSVGVADNYGYLTSATSLSKEGDTWYRIYELWTTDGAVTLKEKVSNSSANKYNAGTLVGYAMDGEDTIKAVEIAGAKGADTSLAAVRAAVTGWNGEDIAFTSKTAGNVTGKVTEDTVVIYVDDENKEGAEGGAISIAEELTTGGFVENVYYVMGNDDEVAALVVDTNNKLDGAVALSNEDPVELDANTKANDIKAMDDGVYVPADDKFVGDSDDVTKPADSNRIFKFTTTGDAKCTLTIWNATDDDPVYTETYSFTGAGGHFFYICLEAKSDAPNAGEGAYKTAAFDKGIYTYTVNDGSADVLTGSFTVEA